MANYEDYDSEYNKFYSKHKYKTEVELERVLTRLKAKIALLYTAHVAKKTGQILGNRVPGYGFDYSKTYKARTGYRFPAQVEAKVVEDLLN